MTFGYLIEAARGNIMKKFLALTLFFALSIGTAATVFADEVIPSETSIISIEAK